MVKYVRSIRGKRLLSVNGFTFYAKVVSGPKTRWSCSTHHYKGCHAVVHTIDDEVVKLINDHNHCLEMKYVTSRRGKQLLSVNDYTFCAHSLSGHKTRWICSTHNTKGCHAVAHTVGDEVVKLKNNHNH
ncbi:jg8370 [Pararge aegeria aegeria]|uniref:Jg8370 protein n=1 Tax=Pararge aegeria aegeria TaxID=348720 RepID=A0A8S4SFA2_9NEOP|nr:jg8370 [Pararge aegeria aegeria]